jgi:hypothetical protein
MVSATAAGPLSALTQVRCHAEPAGEASRGSRTIVPVAEILHSVQDDTESVAQHSK